MTGPHDTRRDAPAGGDATTTTAADRADAPPAPWSLADAAQALGVSYDTLRRWVLVGEVRRVPGPGRMRIPHAEVVRLAGAAAEGEVTP